MKAKLVAILSCSRFFLCRGMHATLLGAFTIGALLLATNPSFAASISFTGSFTGSALIYDPTTDLSPSTGYNPPGNLGGYDGLITLNGFNAALGTLNSVTLTTVTNGSLEFKDARSNGNPTDIINAILFMSAQSPYGGLNVGLPFTFTSNGHGNLVVFDTGVQTGSSGPSSFTNSTSSTFSPFYAATFYLPVLAYVDTTTGTNTSWLTNATSTFTYQETVTYDYTPSAVSETPLPAALPLFATGLGALGLLGWRRKKKTAALAA